VIIATADGRENKDGKRLIILGIEAGNFALMKMGQPMRITAETHQGFPLEDTDIVIIYGETADALANTLKPFFDGNTKIVDHRHPFTKKTQ
jgi:hypothetical protein